ncbi:MAG: hypothetical protein JNL83_39560 [Myxococcales bacterium]|nr:hypothetical protein [Myxococcales bacterium]
MWPFGKKVACFQCDAKVKLASTKLRRGFRFCSDACVGAFLAANVLRPRPGVPESDYTNQAVMELGAAVGELNRLLGSDGVTITGSAGSILGAISAAQAMQQLEDAKDAVFRYNDHVTNALPFLYALGRQADADYLECVDLEEIQDMSALGAGPMQNAKVRRIVRPVAERVARIAESL